MAVQSLFFGTRARTLQTVSSSRLSRFNPVSSGLAPGLPVMKNHLIEKMVVSSLFFWNSRRREIACILSISLHSSLFFWTRARNLKTGRPPIRVEFQSLFFWNSRRTYIDIGSQIRCFNPCFSGTRARILPYLMKLKTS